MRLNLLDLLNSLEAASAPLLIVIPFAVGILSSLHCAGMCMPLAMSVGTSKQELIEYQLGRLLSYFIGLFIVSTLARSLNITTLPVELFTVAMVLFFMSIVWMSFHIWKTGDLEIRLGSGKAYRYLLSKSLRIKRLKSFLLGSLTLLLPCGLLYSLLLVIASLQKDWVAPLMILTFWLGTLPSTLFSAQKLRLWIQGLRGGQRKWLSMGVLSLGFLTLMYRVHVYLDHQVACH